ncbi:MAG TPA: glycosyltransferase family 2 protein [Ignavibacteria bacterium]|nr:glycosyltransferase family 2 protein [Ignavibacteria bacterium]
MVNYNGKHFLGECFESLNKQSFTDFEIVFIDNFSSDGSFEFARENFNYGNVKFFRTDKNLGFAGGNNLGLKHCSGEYIVLLNNDTVVGEVWLEELLAVITSHKDNGMAQSLVITEGIPLRYYEKNGTVNLLGHNVMEIFDIDKDGTGEIFQANGCSLIIKKELADQLGGLFPEEYFAYSEDTYLCMKVKFRGLKIIHTSRSVVKHFGGGSGKNKKPSHLFFYQERNRLLNFLIFFNTGFVIRYIPYLIFNFLMKLILSIFSKKYTFTGIIKVYVWLITNTKWISDKKAELNKLKLTEDNYVLGYISGKIFNGNNVFENIINSMSILYCKIAGLQVLENNGNKKN